MINVRHFIYSLFVFSIGVRGVRTIVVVELLPRSVGIYSTRVSHFVFLLLRGRLNVENAGAMCYITVQVKRFVKIIKSS